MPAWVTPQWEWYYHLWHDWAGKEQPFSFYLVQPPWPLIAACITASFLIIVGVFLKPPWRWWVMALSFGAWAFLMGHLYFPTMT